MLTRIGHALRTRRARAWAGTLAVLVFLAGVVLLGADRAHQTPLVRLHGGAAWLASNKVGQLTLLDGSSAEVAARVSVAAPGSPIRASQLGSTGYALNRWDGSVVRVDGATQQPGRPTNPLAATGDQLTAFPTAHTLYVLDANRGLLAPVDPVALTPRGTPQSLAAQVTPDSSAVDEEGRLWVLDQRTGDLVWFAGDVRHARTHAATPDRTKLNLAGGVPAVLDPARRVAELLDPETGEVTDSVQADLRPHDEISVSGSPQQHRLLISVASRGLLMVCTFGAESCAAPIPLGAGAADLGAAHVTNKHAIVPDYATGRVWIVNLATMQVVVERQLFPSPIRFELLSRDGVIFYNNPDGDQAGVLYLDGRVRAVSKYDPNDPGRAHPTQATDGRATTGPSANTTSAAPVAGPGSGTPDLPVRPVATAIVIKPRDRALVGEELELTVVAPGSSGIASARWTFGDGTEAAGTTVRHRWDRPGEFPVNVAATFTNGQSAPVATATVAIEPAGTPPRIDRINIRPEAPQVGQPVWFSADLTGAQPDRWEWNVTSERGSAAGSGRPQLQHTFAAPGAYTATLKVTAGNQVVEQSRQFSVAPAPPPVRCGDVLTANATLTTDLVCPGDVGLTIAASNVVLDLGGHTLSKSSTTLKDTGIVVQGPGITNVTIQNGRVTAFRTGISLTDVTGVNVANVTVLSSSNTGSHAPGNGADIQGDRARDVRLDTTALTGSWGFVFDNDSTVTFTRSAIEYHLRPVMPVTYVYCGRDSSCAMADTKIRLFNLLCHGSGDLGGPFSSSITVDHSDVLIYSNWGGCRDVTIKDTRLNPMSIGPLDSLTYTRNTVTTAPVGTRDNGFGASQFVISDNQFIGLDVALFTSGSGVVSGNEFTGNRYVGVTIGSEFQGHPEGPIEVRGNTFVRNGNGPSEWTRDRGGIIVHSAEGQPKITIAHNHTQQTTGYSIWATGSIEDGGGNISTDDEKGCSGVKC